MRYYEKLGVEVSSLSHSLVIIKTIPYDFHVEALVHTCTRANEAEEPN